MRDEKDGEKDDETFARYAVYYAPDPDSPLGAFGNAWLGRDPSSHEVLPRPPIAGLDPERVAEASRTPARYGFHGTLKPPFRPVEGVGRDAIEAEVAALAAELTPAETRGLKLDSLGPFLALVPMPDDGPIRPLADTVLHRLEPYRAPLSEAERDRFRQRGLSARQEALLREWGYPFVRDEFRFHLTLTGALDAEERAAIAAALRPTLAPIERTPFRLDALALFGDPGGGRPLRLLARYPLGG